MGSTNNNPAQNVAIAYNTLNQDAATNDSTKATQVQADVQALQTAVSSDTMLSPTVISSIQAQISALLPMAGEPGNGATWNADMQALVATLSALPTSGTSNSTNTSTGGPSPVTSSGQSPVATSGQSPVTTSGQSPVTGSGQSPTVNSVSTSSAALTDTTLYPGGNGPTGSDVAQNQTNDCTLDASMTTLVANNPSAITNMISPQTSDGGYDVTLYPKGTKTTVHVTAADLDPNGTKSTSGQTTWASYVEAAVEKSMPQWDDSTHLSADQQDGGKFDSGSDPSLMIQLLTGSTAVSTPTSQFPSSDSMMTTLNTALTAGKVVMAGMSGSGSSGTEITQDGITLETNHAYAVVSAANGEVTLANPHNTSGQDTGTFTMTAAQFQNAFPDLNVWYQS